MTGADFVKQKASVFEQPLISNYLASILWDFIVLKLADRAPTRVVFFSFSRRERFHLYLFVGQVCACLWQFCVSDSGHGQRCMSWTSDVPLYSTLWQSVVTGGHTCPRPNEQRRVKWEGRVDLPVPRWVASSHPCLRRSPSSPNFDRRSTRSPARLITPRHLRTDVRAFPKTKSPLGRGRWGADGQLRPSKVSTARLACRSANASTIKSKATCSLSAGLQLVFREYHHRLLKSNLSHILSPGSTSLVKLHPSAKPCQVLSLPQFSIEIETAQLLQQIAGHIKLVKGAVDPGNPLSYPFINQENMNCSNCPQTPPSTYYHQSRWRGRTSRSRTLPIYYSIGQSTPFDQVRHQEVCLDHGRKDSCLQRGSSRIRRYCNAWRRGCWSRR